MLSLDSPRWTSFSVYFGTPEEVPRRIALWRESIGGPEEDSEWNDLWEQFLHQGTITDAAYAAVPHVVRELGCVAPRTRFDYLVEFGLIETARQHKNAPAVPEDLAGAYYGAVAEAARCAVECLALDWPKIEFRYLLGALASLHGHGVLGDLLFNFDSLYTNCPKCGKAVYPVDIQKSGYI